MMTESRREVGVATSASEVLRGYLSAQASGDVDGALQRIADDAVFDVGRGRYRGREQIRSFVERLMAVHSRATVLELDDVSAQRAIARFQQSDDDLAPLGIDSIELGVQVDITKDGRISAFTARPTPESLAALAAARDAGHRSEGMRLAEQAGTLPPPAGERPKP
jgi:hypothetical protein